MNAKVFNSGLLQPRKIIFSILIFFLICGSAFAATITVQPGESIQEAIDQASSGDIIEVMSGTYQGNLDIKKETLIGIDSGDGMPVIDAGLYRVGIYDGK